MTAEQSDAPCQSPATTSATTLVVRHGDVSASRPPTDTTSRHAPYGPVPRIVNGQLPAGARNIDLIARREALSERLATLTPRSLAAIKCRIELEWVVNDLLRLKVRP